MEIPMNVVEVNEAKELASFFFAIAFLCGFAAFVIFAYVVEKALYKRQKEKSSSIKFEVYPNGILLLKSTAPVTAGINDESWLKGDYAGGGYSGSGYDIMGACTAAASI